MRLARLNDNPEIFYSLQGEGASMGTPSIFVRLFGCNLRCSWCDTAYSWDKGHGFIGLSPEEVKEIVAAFPCRHIVITGGEPLAQQRELVALMALLPGYEFEIETNGTLMPDAALNMSISQYNVSPKLVHSGNAPQTAIKPDVLKHFADVLKDKSWFKFVVNDQKDVDDISDLAKLAGIERERIILMPQAANKPDLESKRLAVAELAIANGFRFSDRLHITLWGDKKGV